MPAVTFDLEARCKTTGARVGILNTPHGRVYTPAFMPVATRASVRGLTPEEATEVGASILLSNTYHLYLQPGVETVRTMGGLHRFMGWSGPILTDSGGYQAFSMGYLKKVSEEGVLFRSHIDGSEHMFTPESSIQHQEGLGADVVLCLDECVAYGEPEEKVRSAMERTHRWATRSLEVHRSGGQALFGVLQGGVYTHLREESARFFASQEVDGYSIGGLAVGEPKADMYAATGDTCAMLPETRPRHLLGVGSPEDLVECVAQGVDMFDCVLPTRIARNGALLTRSGRIDVKKAGFRQVEGPVEDGCDCYTCNNFSVAYLHHLFKARELLGLRLATIHNLRFVLRLMEEMQQAIFKGNFPAFRKRFLAGYKPTDEKSRSRQKDKWLRKRGILRDSEGTAP